MAYPLPEDHRHRATVLKVLGGEKVIRKRLGTPLEQVALVRAGLPYGSVSAAARSIAGSTEEIADSLGLARRTLARRKQAGRLDPTESDKLLNLAVVAARATEVLGSEEDMQRWLRAPNAALGKATPLELLDTSVGYQEVLNVLGRLEHGVFS